MTKRALSWHRNFEKENDMANTQELTEEEKELLRAGCHGKKDQKLSPCAGSNIKHVIGVVSGKGGVGKSLVTSLLAAELRRRGFAVGILDADVTGPSIPRAFGVHDRLMTDEEGIFVAESASGVEMISTNLMLPEEDAPIAWRGPAVSSAISQFFTQVHWGDLDYLLVDMPPGTSDVFLTVLQKLPIDGIVTVSAPQELVAMIVGKAVNLASQLNVPVLGLVENMAYFMCPDCNKKHFIFGTPQGAEVAKHYGIPATAELPIDPRFAQLCDAGRVEEYDVQGALDSILDVLVKA